MSELLSLLAYSKSSIRKRKVTTAGELGAAHQRGRECQSGSWELVIPWDCSEMCKWVRGLSGQEKASAIYLKGSFLDTRQVGVQIQFEPVKQLMWNVVEPLNQNSLSLQQVCLLKTGMRLENVLSLCPGGALCTTAQERFCRR